MGKVVNIKDYGSRKMIEKVHGDDYVYIGGQTKKFRRSPLANPYSEARYGRTQAIALYKKWLWKKIHENDPDVIRTLRKIRKGTKIVCWCKPEACHGDVVKSAAEWVRAHK